MFHSYGYDNERILGTIELTQKMDWDDVLPIASQQY